MFHEQKGSIVLSSYSSIPRISLWTVTSVTKPMANMTIASRLVAPIDRYCSSDGVRDDGHGGRGRRFSIRIEAQARATVLLLSWHTLSRVRYVLDHGRLRLSKSVRDQSKDDRILRHKPIFGHEAADSRHSPRANGKLPSAGPAHKCSIQET